MRDDFGGVNSKTLYLDTGFLTAFTAALGLAGDSEIVRLGDFGFYYFTGDSDFFIYLVTKGFCLGCDLEGLA